MRREPTGISRLDLRFIVRVLLRQVDRQGLHARTQVLEAQ
jgi:hypothetical protein